jgi:cysteine-rich repeat protein
LAAGCNYFDDEAEALIQGQTGAGGMGGDDAGEADAGPTLLEPADFCDRNVPVRATDDLFLQVDTRGLTDGFSNLGCGSSITRTLTETDAFFKVHLDSGDWYHFHVKAKPEQNLAVYLLSDCREENCVGAADRCPAGADEHFSFVPNSAGDYFLGIDGISDGPTDEPVEFLATRSSCGDNVKQHHEVCDDGNTDNADACDDTCRAVLRNGGDATRRTEKESNADRYGANVLAIDPGETIDVLGIIGGACDTDSFFVQVPEGGSISAEVMGPAGGMCGSSAVPVLLRLLNNAASQAEITSAEGDDTMPCPVMQSAALSAGDYYVTMRTSDNSTPQFDYILRVTVSAAATTP